MNQVDDGLDWLREIRAKLAQQCDYNPYKLGEYYASLQAPFLSLEENPMHNRRQGSHTHNSGIGI